MKQLFWIGIVVLIVGVASLAIPIPHHDSSGISVGGASIGIRTSHSEKVSPIVSCVLILAGAGMMMSGRSAVAS
jgi:hypothetical protein